MQLNMEQKKLITSGVMGQSLIKGVAGSGKTTVAVNRISFLLNHHCVEPDDKILMVTYNKSLINYIEYIYTNIEKEEQISLFARDTIEDRVFIRNIDKLIHNYFVQFCREEGEFYTIAKFQQENEILQECIWQLQKSFPEVKVLDGKFLGFSKKEIQWIKSCNYMELEEYQNVDRIGRTGSRNNENGPKKLLKNSQTRQSIHELMRLYQRKMAKKNLCDFQDIILMALQYMKTHKITKFTHIIIDESQDLSRIQLECLRELYNQEKEYSSILFVADTAQSIYEGSWLVKGRSFASIGMDMTGKSNLLSKNYRTTTQIAEAAYSLISHDIDITGDDNFVKPSLIDRQGSYPVLRNFLSLDDEIHYVKDLILRNLSRVYERKDIAVIARTKKLLEQVEAGFGKELSSNLYTSSTGIDFQSNDVKLLTMHSIKGLEFKVVILIGISEKIIPNNMALAEADDVNYAETMERKLLYVGMTRATERLYISSHNEPSRFIRDINASFLRLKEGARLHNLHQVPLKDYLFLNKIDDPYTKEESVRQWLIRELTEIYRYPAKMLDIEYRVQLFSKTGFVDIVVYIYANNEMIPYIFAEVKQPGYGIKNALEQMKSYLAAAPKACYAIITDGNELKIWDRNLSEIEDIPVFDTSMLPSSIEYYQYMDLNKSLTVNFLRDIDNPNEIIIGDSSNQEIISKSRLTRIPMFSSIAAGQPIDMLDDMVELCYFPSEWLVSPQESFILSVKGNSMINANISDGDLIVLKKSNVAQNGQIVAVDIDGSVTLKRLRQMGSMVLLITEHDDYEQMGVNAKQVRILGLEQGVIKKRQF